MSDRELSALAHEAGLSVRWTDAFGQPQRVAPDTLRLVLAALGYDARNASAIRDSRRRVAATRRTKPSAKGPKAYFPTGFDHRLWGLAVQLYALRGGRTKGFGDFAALESFVKDAARAGADAVAISPVHASVPSREAHYSPYSPSSRLFLDPLFAPVPSGSAKMDRTKLIDWQAEAEAKLRSLDQAYRRFQEDGRDRDVFARFVRAGGTQLLDHARFEALHARFAKDELHDWRRWPAPYRDARSSAVRALSARDPDVERYLFFQWLADRGLAAAQRAAKKAGMAIGIIADIAVGLDPAGSYVWSAPQDVLRGLSIGAPPDLLARDGQNWGLTALSPSGLRAGKFVGFSAVLRANMRHAGGIRIDHAMGLKRLWLIPEGGNANDGVYLAYPFDELLALVARESRRAKAIVIAEDLGTVPPGFREALADTGLLGMRVLPFERDGKGGFKDSARWDVEASALTATHDIATVAGWWSGRDIDWRTRISQTFPEAKVRRERNKERKLLWQALSGEKAALVPGPRREQEAVDAAIAFVARAPSKLALFPVEDIAGLVEQPNLPGTTSEHPNWRRRLPPGNRLQDMRAKRRLAVIAKARAT